MSLQFCCQVYLLILYFILFKMLLALTQDKMQMTIGLQRKALFFNASSSYFFNFKGVRYSPYTIA